MTCPSSSTSNSDPRRYLRVFATTAFIVVAMATALTCVGYRFGIIDLPVFDLYLYQQKKLASAAPVETILVGDSTLGNGIDAAYWSELSGHPTLNLALAGSYGYPGYYNMLRQAVTAKRPKLVVIMATAETMLRDVPYRGYLITTTWADAIRVVPPSTFIETYVNAEAAWRVLRGIAKDLTGSRKSRLRDDYVAQRAPLVDPAAYAQEVGDVFDPGRIRPEQREFLYAMAELCRAESLTCVYAHGPILDVYCRTSQPYFAAASDLVRSAGLRIVDRTPVCMPPSDVGDERDHVRSEVKREYTQKYYELVMAAVGGG